MNIEMRLAILILPHKNMQQLEKLANIPDKYIKS